MMLSYLKIFFNKNYKNILVNTHTEKLNTTKILMLINILFYFSSSYF
jgi:hypothetical protein